MTRDEAIDYNSGDLPNFHAHQLRDIIGAVRDKRPPAVTGEDGRRVVAIIQGVYESGRTGRPVRLSAIDAVRIGADRHAARARPGKWQALCRQSGRRGGRASGSPTRSRAGAQPSRLRWRALVRLG